MAPRRRGRTGEPSLQATLQAVAPTSYRQSRPLPSQPTDDPDAARCGTESAAPSAASQVAGWRCSQRNQAKWPG
eukprot:6209862-Pleurochrysis_carterae.AAC.1